jgi:RimJ/RimL family protein N-acetyltransferase
MPTLPPTLTLPGDGVILRDWLDSDAAALEPACGDRDICTFTSVPWSYSPDRARAWLQRQRQLRTDSRALALAITRPEAGPALGNVNLVRFSAEGTEAALGYWLVARARGQGLATAAARLLCAWGFTQLGLERIQLAILPENVACHHVAEALGATRQGIRRHRHEAAGRLWDMVIYRLEPRDGSL